MFQEGSQCMKTSSRIALRSDAPSCISSQSPALVSRLSHIRSSLMEARALLELTDHAMLEYIQMQQMASVEHLARELGHDFRNGLMTLGGLIRQLELSLPHEKVREKTGIMWDILKNLDALVSHLRSFGNNEVCEDDLFVQEFSEEIRRVIELMRSSLGSEIQVNFQMCSKSLPLLVSKGDIWRIVSNLVLNAKDAMSEGGELLIMSEDRQVDATYCSNHGNAHPGHFAVLCVQDQGKGICPEILPRIFDPLFSTNPPREGEKRGWGLAIVYALVRRRGGWIDVESSPGNGTRFEVFLPLHAAGERL